ncbi:hypothetical protein VKT23_010251 [Stygiomarasmius scandens]|uniref:Uncharacterized protein n=1 Tax=Marasmiellus scandens TaxID=2682957 RepID=A0ABR1JD35_9AGAR
MPSSRSPKSSQTRAAHSKNHSQTVLRYPRCSSKPSCARYCIAQKQRLEPGSSSILHPAVLRRTQSTLAAFHYQLEALEGQQRKLVAEVNASNGKLAALVVEIKDICCHPPTTQSLPSLFEQFITLTSHAELTVQKLLPHTLPKISLSPP